jgi:hypothetical protein
MDILKALETYCKNTKAEFSCGETYESLQWFPHSDLPMPTYQDLEDAYTKFKVDAKKNEYKELRAKEYPSVEEQLDMIYHTDLDTWRDVILKVKNKYPKQEGEKYTKPENKLAVMVDGLMKDFQDLNAKLDNDKVNNADIKNIVNEINAAMSAIKVFLMEIPNIQKSINDIKTKLESE